MSYRMRKTVEIAFVVMATSCARNGPTPALDGTPPALGAHALVTHDQNRGVSPATTPPVVTQTRGSALLAFSLGRTVNFAAPTDSLGNRWSLVGQRHAYANGPFYTAVFSSLDAAGGAGHTLSATVADDPKDEISLALVEITHGHRIRDVAYAYPPKESALTPGEVTTDGPATLVALWSGDSFELVHTAVPSDGFQVIESYLKLGPTSGVQVAAAVKQVAQAGTYSVTWTATPAQGAACYLIAIE